MLYRPRRHIEKKSAGTPYVLERVHYTGEVVDLAEIAIYHRVRDFVSSTARGIRARSTGSIHGYIAFVLGTLFVILLFAVGV